MYRSAEAVLMPGEEDFGIVPLEAQACGTPVITANVSSLPEVTGEAALLVDPRSVTELASAMVRLAGDAGLRETLRAKGLARARLFSWQRTAAQTLAVYEEVAGRQ